MFAKPYFSAMCKMSYKTWTFFQSLQNSPNIVLQNSFPLRNAPKIVQIPKIKKNSDFFIFLKKFGKIPKCSDFMACTGNYLRKVGNSPQSTQAMWFRSETRKHQNLRSRSRSSTSGATLIFRPFLVWGRGSPLSHRQRSLRNLHFDAVQSVLQSPHFS